MEKSARTNFEIWTSSFYNEAMFPPSWNKSWGLPTELWLIEKAGDISLYYSKPHILHQVNEDMRGRAPVWHVWNIKKDQNIYCGQSQQTAYSIYQQEIKNEADYDSN